MNKYYQYDDETDALKQNNTGRAFLVFPESRDYSIRMNNDVPYRWIQKGVASAFTGEAASGEYFAYQLGVYALQDLEGVQIEFSSHAIA